MPMLKWLWLSVVVVLLDQASKQWMVSLLNLHETLPMFAHFNLTMAHNTGAAFSFLADAGGWQHWFFLTIVVIVSIVIIRWLAGLTSTAKLEALALSLVLGGAVGNMIDRIWHGYVIDFLQFYADFLKPILGSAYFPSFNLADSAIFLGAALLILDSFISKPEEEHA